MKRTTIRNKNNLFLLLITIAIIFERSYMGINDWRYTHWLFNYEIEFVKRGLIGETIRTFRIQPSFELVNTISISIVVIIAITLTYIIGRSFSYIKTSGNTSVLWLLFLALLSNSATLQHYVYDIGRFDSVNLVLLFLAILIIEKSSTIVQSIVIPILGLLMLLIHEASFFLFIPVMLAYWAFRTDEFKKPALTLIVLSVLTYQVATNGLMHSQNLKEHAESIHTSYNIQPSESSLNVLHRDLNANIEFTSSSIDSKRIIDHVTLLITSLPTLIILWLLTSPIIAKSQDKWKLYILLLSCLSPLALYPLGEDHFRWWAITLTNLTIVISLLYYSDQKLKHNALKIAKNKKSLLYTIIILSFLLGPFGNPSLYPLTLNHYFLTWLS